MSSALSKAPLFLILLGSCRSFDEVPAYLTIPSMDLTTLPEQGEPTSKITDVWVSVNDKFSGVWELPARIPVLAEGNHRITVVPAIKRNGTYDDRLRYPFFTSWEGTVELTAKETASIDPSTSYASNTLFTLEPFDAVGTLLDAVDGEDTLLIFRPDTDPDLVRDDSPVGGVELTSSNPLARVHTDLNLTASAGPVFLEMDYSTDVELTVGVEYRQEGFDIAEPVVTVVPTTGDGRTPSWNKIYIDLSTLFNTSGLTQRDIYIEGRIGPGGTSGLFLLENLKLVRRQ
jgi:hypothetical protein